MPTAYCAVFGIVSDYGPLTTAVGIAGMVVFTIGVSFGAIIIFQYPVLDDYKHHAMITAVVGGALITASTYMIVPNGDR